MGVRDVDVDFADGTNARSGTPGEFLSRSCVGERSEFSRNGFKLAHETHAEIGLRVREGSSEDKRDREFELGHSVIIAYSGKLLLSWKDLRA